MNAEQALAVLDECTDQLEAQPGCYYTDAVELQKARAFFADLIRREALQRNALEHIANTCPGRAAEVARAGLSEPQEPQA